MDVIAYIQLLLHHYAANLNGEVFVDTQAWSEGHCFGLTDSNEVMVIFFL